MMIYIVRLTILDFSYWRSSENHLLLVIEPVDWPQEETGVPGENLRRLITSDWRHSSFMQLRRNYDETKLQNKQVQPTIYTICFYHYHNRLHCFLHSRKIEFEGVCGNGYRGDIALDNITLTEGKCPTIQRNNTGSKSLSCRNCFCLFSSCLFPLFKPCCVSRVPV